MYLIAMDSLMVFLYVIHNVMYTILYNIVRIITEPCNYMITQNLILKNLCLYLHQSNNSYNNTKTAQANYCSP